MYSQQQYASVTSDLSLKASLALSDFGLEQYLTLATSCVSWL